jgi:restriction system protein
VRGGDNNELAALIKTKHAVAIGWSEAGDVSSLTSKEALRERLESEAPNIATPNGVGQLYRFVREITIGDIILTPEKATAQVHVTRCTGEYRFDPSIFGDYYPQTRAVEYVKSVTKADFPAPVRNTLGSLLTVFRADAAAPYLSLDSSSQPMADTSALATKPSAADVDAEARGVILEALDEIEPYEFQRFVGGLLEAMGYTTEIGPKGKDGGVDFLAYPDPFGLKSPRIKGQTKRQRATAGIADVGYLNGVLGGDERGLFVCTGGFSKDAEQASFVKNGRVALLDGPRLLELVTKYYDELASDVQRLLPLKRIYILDPAEDLTS